MPMFYFVPFKFFPKKGGGMLHFENAGLFLTVLLISLVMFFVFIVVPTMLVMAGGAAR